MLVSSLDRSELIPLRRGVIERYGMLTCHRCYCDNKIETVAGAVATTCPATSNLMLCAGSRSEYCGASNLLNIYYSSNP